MGAVRSMLDSLRSTLSTRSEVFPEVRVLKRRGRNWWTAQIDKALSDLDHKYGSNEMDWYLWAALEAAEVPAENVRYIHRQTAQDLGWDDFYSRLRSSPYTTAAVETIGDLKYSLREFQPTLRTRLRQHARLKLDEARDKVEEVLDAPIRYEDAIYERGP